MSKDFLNVGKIVNTHGVRGEVRVMSVTDFEEERFEPGSRLFVEVEGGKHEEVVVMSHRKHKQFDLLVFEGHESLDQAERFKGHELKVAFDDLEDLDEDEFYYYEIIGCDVYLTTGEHLGKIKEILSPGANDVWVVKRSEEGLKDALIPYIDDVVKEVDIDNQKVVIEEMEGLLS
ncbi:16S rRNA processing protein RimM [Alkalibacillus filiformis]|uniref:Ribosome maturation factor RimM n=1 Tax=Alkalibacillus filiformis TaxID=200990 RepID=A0ABU0DQG4_9BACI|nr:ribosome maturation factor RimM [Alkalibacillus filiformis]MDQ0350600.1 16S rRNA processing protein RimM [Alkalibacillus filiformis]